MMTLKRVASLKEGKNNWTFSAWLVTVLNESFIINHTNPIGENIWQHGMTKINTSAQRITDKLPSLKSTDQVICLINQLVKIFYTKSIN